MAGDGDTRPAVEAPGEVVDPEAIRRVYESADRLYGAAEVEAALDRMAAEITERLSGREPLILCVLLGGIVTTGKLLTRLDFPLHLDYVHATRYRGDTRGRELYWIARPVQRLRDRVVLVVDDILDEGITLKAILDECREAGAREVYAATLVDKQCPRKADVRPEFCGLQVENRYVFGYGMDYKGYLRNASGIYAVKDS